MRTQYLFLTLCAAAGAMILGGTIRASADVTVAPRSHQDARVLVSTATPNHSIRISLAIAPPSFPNVSTSPHLTPACYRYNRGWSQCTKDLDRCSGMCRR